MTDPSQGQSLPAPGALVTEDQLASRWLVSTRTLQRWRQRCVGPAYLRLGQRVVYRLTDIDAFEAAARHRSGSGS